MTAREPADGVRPDVAAAAARAEQMAYERDHPAQQTVRPRSVVVGCALTWIGAAITFFVSLTAFTVDSDSDVFADDASPSDLDNGVHAFHVAGVVFVVWAMALVVVAVLAFRGARWAATTLLSMAVVVALLTALALFTGFAFQAIAVTLYSLIAALLVRRSERSRNWYDARRTSVSG